MNAVDVVVALNRTVDALAAGASKEDLAAFLAAVAGLAIFGGILSGISQEFKEAAGAELFRIEHGEDPNRG